MAWNPKKTFKELKEDPYRAARAAGTGGQSEVLREVQKDPYRAARNLATGGLSEVVPAGAKAAGVNLPGSAKKAFGENPLLNVETLMGVPIAVENPYAASLAEALKGPSGELSQYYKTGAGATTDLIGQLQRQMKGDFGAGGSLAQKILEQSLGQNVAGVRSQLASTKGLSPAMAARMASQQIAQLGGQSAQQAGILGLQQQLAAQSQLGQLAGGAAQQGLQFEAQRLGQLASSDVGMRQLQAQSGMAEKELRLKIEAANQAAKMGDRQMAAGIIGSILGGGASIAAAAAGAPKGAYAGGRIDGMALKAGDHPDNDIVDAKLSPGEIVIPRSAATSKKAAKSFIESLDDFDEAPSYGSVLKARQERKKFAEGGVVEPDLDQEILDKYKRQQVQKGFDVPIPGIAPMKRGFDDMLTSRVVEPMARAGYPDLGAAMATVPSTLAEALVPSTAADLAGMLIPFPGSKLRKKAKEVLKSQEAPNIPAVEYAVDWANSSSLNNLIKRLGDDKKLVKNVENILNSKGQDPYFGDVHNAMWKTGPSLEKLGLPQPIPQQVENLQGVLGREVPQGGSDPFQWIDTKYQVTKKLLEKNIDKPLVINTRSDLIAHDDYMNLLNPSKHKINIHLLGDGDVDGLARVMEPGAPSIRRRLSAAQKLSEAGFDVTLVKDVLKNKNIPQELQQMLFQSQPTGDFKVKQNIVDVSDEAVEKMKKLLGDNFK